MANKNDVKENAAKSPEGVDPQMTGIPEVQAQSGEKEVGNKTEELIQKLKEAEAKLAAKEQEAADAEELIKDLQARTEAAESESPITRVTIKKKKYRVVSGALIAGVRYSKENIKTGKDKDGKEIKIAVDGEDGGEQQQVSITDYLLSKKSGALVAE